MIMTDRPKTHPETEAAPASTQPATRNDGQVFSSPPPYGTGKGVMPIPDGLEEQGRSVCLSLEGPSGRVLARVELVLLGPAQPLKMPLSLPGPSQAASSSAGTH